MPNFRITRKRKPALVLEPVQKQPTRPSTPPPVTQEEKYDDSEMEMSESSDEPYIDRAMSQLNMEQAQTRPRNHLPPPNTPHSTSQKRPQVDRRATFAPQLTKPTSFEKHFGPTPRINDPYRRKPTMQRPVVRRKAKSGGARIRFRSHYGADAEHLDTRTKSLMLLNHCFG